MARALQHADVQRSSVRGISTPVVALTFVCLTALPVLAQAPRVEVRVDRTSITVDDELEMTVTSSGEFDRDVEPPTPGFSVVGRSQSEQLQIAGGQISKSKQVAMRLRPLSPGRHTIGPARLLTGGRQVAASKPIVIEVKAAVQAPTATASSAQDLSRHLGNRLFLTAETPRTSYYVGEPFVLTWNLNFHPDVQIQSIEVVNAPKLEGMLAEEMITEQQANRLRQRNISGQRIQYATRSLQLVTGLEPGRVVVDPMTMRVTTVGSRRRRSRYTVRSEPFAFDLLPVPTEGRPPAFREGNLGRLSLTSSVRRGDGQEATRVHVGERLILEAVVSGYGNLDGVKAPVLEEKPGFDVQRLPAANEDEIHRSATGVRGKRVFMYLLKPLGDGAQVTPAVHFAFFDTEGGAYRGLTSPGVSIDVVASTTKGGGGGSPIAGAVPRGEDIGPTLHGVSLGDASARRWVGTVPFWLWFGLPLLGFVAVETWARVGEHRSRNVTKHRERAAYGNAKKRLKLAEQARREGLVGDFYDHLNRTFTAYFEERVNLGARGMTHDALATSLKKVGYDDELVDAVIVELENCDFARFAPKGDAEDRMRDTLDRAQRLLRRLDGVRPGRRP